MKKVLYEELLPEEFVQRMLEMPVAYLPLGTLEWHGPHMPLEADGIQSKELFQDYLRSIFAQLSREIKNRQNLKNLHWLTKPMEIFYFLKQYLRIGSVKDIIMKSQFLQNGLHIFPIIIYIKFIAVSPDI